MKKYSVVILCYNSLFEATKPCIESLLKNTDLGSVELILVDNNSTDGTPDFLRGVKAKYPGSVKLILNVENKGYAAGNNLGSELASGEFVILLNNDTIVGEEWLERLTWPFHRWDDVGLVGPLSNSVGNEQHISLPNLSKNGFEHAFNQYSKKVGRLVCETSRLGFFCVAMRRQILEQIGGLDEGFGIGMFEDDDYCLRVKKQGYRVLINEYCFIYHLGSASFKKLDSEKYKKLFLKNKLYFNRKHNTEWLFTDIALAKIEYLANVFEGWGSEDVYSESVNARVISRIDSLISDIDYLKAFERRSFGFRLRRFPFFCFLINRAKKIIG